MATVSGIVIDLAGADYLSSPGLRAIVALATKMEERKGQVIVRGARDAVRVPWAWRISRKPNRGKGDGSGRM